MMRARPVLVLLMFLGLTLAAAPRAVAQTPSPALLVLEKEDLSLAIVDPASLKIVGRVPAGEDPHEVAVTSDGRTAYVANYGAFGTPHHTLSVVDLATQKPLAPIELGALLAPHGIQNSGGKLYFTAEGSKAIARVDPATRQVDWVLGLGQNRTHMLVVRGSRIFTANVNSDTVSILDPDAKADGSGWNVSLVPVGKGPEGFDVSPDGRELWAANSHDGTVSIVDVASRKVVHAIDLHTKFANRLQFTPDGKLVLVSDLGTGELIVLDAQARREVKRLSLGKGAAGILIPPDGTRAFIALPPDKAVVVLDLKTLAVAGKISTGRGPDGMAWAVKSGE